MYLNRDTVKKILALDNVEVTEDNLFSAKLALEEWQSLLSEQNPQYGKLVLSYALRYGLKRTIQEACDCSEILMGRGFHNNAFTGIVATATDERSVLQCLRFLKRFCYPDDDSLREEAVSQFFERTRGWAQLDISDYLRSVIKSKFSDIVGSEKNYRRNEVAYLTESYFDIPSGVAYDIEKDRLVRTQGEKITILNEYVKYRPSNPGIKRFVYDQSKEFTPISKLIAVPKNYKTSRVIAVEHPLVQFRLGAISNYLADRIKRYTKGRIDIQDQSRNRNLAQLGSAQDSYATIDLSAASDSNTQMLQYQICPDWLYREISPWISRHVRYNGKTRRVNTFGTMGTRITFPLEMVTFVTVVEVARDFYNTLVGEPRITLDDIAVYGDDIIVPKELVSTVSDLLGILGFTVNTEKTYSSGPFRESCGGDYYNGVDVSTSYWPRTPIRRDMSTIPSLVSLQHRLVQHFEANLILVNTIRDIVPSITESEIGSPYTDIWSAWPVLTLREGKERKYALTYSKFSDAMRPDGKRYVAVRKTKKVHHVQTATAEYHSTFPPKWKNGRPSADIQEFLMYRSLYHGGCYASELDKLLQVTDKPLHQEWDLPILDRDHVRVLIE
nr:MAG: replicase [Leviviridae sp.]